MHSINVIIFKEADIIDITKLNVHVKLKQGLIMIDHTDSNFENMQQLLGLKPFITVFTDYFGGSGEQGSYYYPIETYHSMTSINVGLKKLGVERAIDSDEFDTVGLGNYRSNRNAFEKPLLEKTQIKKNYLETLLDDYKQRLSIIQIEIDKFKYSCPDNLDYTRCKTKASCYLIFIAELEQAVSKQHEA